MTCLSAHPDINLKRFNDFDSGNLTESNYLIGMVIVKMIEDECCHQKLLEVLRTMRIDNDLRYFMNEAVKINADDTKK